MAAAVTADIEVYGPERVVALAVSHADCEDLADRIRADLAAGVIGGEVLEGPGWAGARRYQAGDRVLLHAHVDLDRRPAAHQRHHPDRHRGQRRRAERHRRRRPGCAPCRPGS